MTHPVKKTVGSLVFSIAAVLLLAVSALAAEEDMAVAVGTTTGSSLRMRSEASTNSSIVTMLNRDVAVAVLDDSLDGWYQVNYNGNVGFVSADYLEIDEDNSFTSYGRVNGNGVNVRSAPSTDGDILTTADQSDIVTVNGFEDGWYDITFEDDTGGYIRSDFLVLTSSSSGVSSSDIVNYARQFLGTRYVYGGSSPSGFDCSGFTMYIYRQFGYSLPHTASGQWTGGMGTRIYSISDLQPGDLVFFNDPKRNAGKACSHVGIYIGNGQHIHASSSKSGSVIISDLTSGYYNTYFVGGIHM